MLRNMVVNGHSHDTEIYYNSNGTVYPEQAEDIWKDFTASKEITSGISKVVSNLVAVEQGKTDGKVKSIIITEKKVTNITSNSMKISVEYEN